MMNSTKETKGYMTLISLLIVGAIATAITTTTILLGVGSTRTALAKQESSEALYLTNACAEEALQRIREETSYTGTDGLILDNGSCQYTINDMGEERRTINASGTVNQVVKKMQLEISRINPQITVDSWKEVADF